MRARPVRIVVAGLATAAAAASLGAQSTALPDVRAAMGDTAGVPLDLSLVDVPYGVAHGLRAPSMRQSLELTTDVYELAHAGIQRAFGPHRRAAKFGEITWDFVTGALVPLPFTDPWVHEEFHRSALGVRGVGSFDDVYRMQVASSTISVSHVSDADLVRFKRDHPAEYVRAEEAGVEGEYVFAQQIERNRFFHDSPARSLTQLWLSKLGAVLYVASTDSKDTDSLTAQMNHDDGASVSKRDWVGYDFTGWTYDLHRPDEPYAARGVHPSGVGIDRYIARSDLTPAELRYVDHIGRLQFLNFADPFLFGWGGATIALGGAPVRVTANLSHFLTSFGHTVDANVFARRGASGTVVTLHAYENGVRWLPGVDVELLDRPLTLAGDGWTVSPRAAVWLQPSGQRFDAHGAVPGGLVAATVRAPSRRSLGTFAEVFGKTRGWVAGVPQLDASVGLRLGATWTLRP